MALPKQHVMVLNSFLRETTSEDDFHEMVMICYAVWRDAHSHRDALAKQRIKSFFSTKSKDYFNLYRNALSLDQCIGDSSRPVYDYFNPRKGEDPCH